MAETMTGGRPPVDLTLVTGCQKAIRNQLEEQHRFATLISKWIKVHDDAKVSIAEMRIEVDKVEDRGRMAVKDLKFVGESILALRKIRRDAESTWTEEDKMVDAMNVGAEEGAYNMCKFLVKKGLWLRKHALEENIRTIEKSEEAFQDKMYAVGVTGTSYYQNVRDYCQEVQDIGELLAAAMEPGVTPYRMPPPAPFEALNVDRAMMAVHVTTMTPLVELFSVDLRKNLREAAILTGCINEKLEIVGEHANAYKKKLEEEKEQAQVRAADKNKLLAEKEERLQRLEEELAEREEEAQRLREELAEAKK